MIRRRFTIDDYVHMHETGVIAPGERVELIEGDVHVMSPVGIRHACVVDRLNSILNDMFRRRAIVSVQSTAQIAETSMPEPDLAVKVFCDDFYSKKRATVAETLLFIEVADTSVKFDRDTKIPLYGRSGIRETWLVDLPANIVYRFTNPRPEGYGAPEEFRPGDMLTSTIAGVELKISVAELLA